MTNKTGQAVQCNHRMMNASSAQEKACFYTMLPTIEAFKLPLPQNTVLAFCSGLPSSCLPCDTILIWKVSGQLSPVGLSTDSECFILGTDWRFSGEGEGAGSVCYVLEGVKTLSLKAHWGPFIFPDAEWNFSGLGFWRGPWEWFV